MTRSAEEIRAEIDPLEVRMRVAVEAGDRDAWHALGAQVLPLYAELDWTTVPVARDDVRASVSALRRWADACAPGADSYLRSVIGRLEAALQ